MKTIWLFALLALAVLWGCSKPLSWQEIALRNGMKIQLSRLNAEIEQRILLSPDPSKADIPAILDEIASKDPNLVRNEYEHASLFCVNPNVSLWLQTNLPSKEVAVFSPRPFIRGGETNFVVALFSGDTLFSNSLPTWKPVRARINP